jgi:hypothetical protein
MRRALALALLLSCSPAAAADAPDPSHDLDGDGVVTRKEERQARRAARRANRRARQGVADDLADDGGSTTEEDTARQQSAAGKAAALARSMSSMLPSSDAGALPTGAADATSALRPAGAAGAGPATTGAVGPTATTTPASPMTGRAAAASTGDPANPRTPEDLLLAARSGYAPALEKAGLRLSADGKGFVRVSDGKAASSEDLERLRAAVSSMPEAIARRPDFYSKVSPEHFAALQTGYREQRSPAVYKDVGATEKERDFVHTRSCARMSGDCNENTTRASYRKGEHVAPEDLERMFQALAEELAAAEAEDASSPVRHSAASAAEEAAPQPGAASDVAAAPLTKEARRAAGEAAAFAAAPAIFPNTVRRAWAKTVAAISPTAAQSGYADLRAALALLALSALAAGALLRRRR